MFSNLSTTEIIIIALILLVFLGSNKLKELARGLGESAKELKKMERTISGEDE